VVIVGTTTSGCVRSEAVDAFSLNTAWLAEEVAFDRSEASHASACATCTRNTQTYEGR